MPSLFGKRLRWFQSIENEKARRGANYGLRSWMGAQEGVDMRLEVEGQEVALAPGSVHHLVCIGQEAVTNALRHAVPNMISVHLQYHADWLSLSVKDDGRGF